MPRIRTIKPDFFTSPDVARVDFPVRLFYQALWCWADDFGVGETNLNGLLGFAFPDSDGFTAHILRRFCADCAQHFGITFYTVAGRHYYAIPTWEKHQKLEKRSDRRKYPTPDHPDATPDLRIYDCADSAPDMPRKIGAESRKNSAGKGTGEQGNREQGKELTTDVVSSPRTAKRRAQIREDYKPSRTVIDAIKAETGAGDDALRYQHRKFIDHWLKTGKPMADWDACWRNWMRTAAERGELGPTVQPTPTTRPSKLRALADLAAEVRQHETATGLELQA